MIEGGYYIKARKIQDSLIAHSPPHYREIWDWLIKEANHKDMYSKGKLIKRGQLFRSYNDIREGLSWFIGYRKMMYNENQTKKAMKFLREGGMIDTAKEPRGILITVCNYDSYQNPKNYEGTDEGTTERTIEEPVKNQCVLSINKNDKEVKNDKKERVYDDAVHNCLENCLTYFPEELQPKDGDSWLDTIDKLNRIDGVKFNQIENVVKGIRRDDFWSKNFLSMNKLRKNNKEGVRYVIVFSQYLKSSRNGKKEQLAEITAAGRNEYQDI